MEMKYLPLSWLELYDSDKTDMGMLFLYFKIILRVGNSRRFNVFKMENLYVRMR